MRLLIVPGNNSLSHLFKSFSVADKLMARGHEAVMGVARNRTDLVRSLGYDHHVLPDLQEVDGAGFPTVEWFRHPRHIKECIQAEVDLMRQVRPDRALGVFRFTLQASAQLAGVPFDSLVCGCMMPECRDVLGFAEGEPGMEYQRAILIGFYRYAGDRVSTVLSAMGLERVEDVRCLLKGEHTFLWDFPEFLAIEETRGLVHIGPFASNHMPQDHVSVDAIADGSRPLAIVGFGTCTPAPAIVERLTRILIHLGYHVVVAAGAREDMLSILPDHPRVTVCWFAPMDKLLPYARLVVTHGGQMTVFESLQQSVPVLVMPFQPEQAHNGVCLERIGCGCRLIPSVPFIGDPGGYVKALDRMTDQEIAAKTEGLVSQEQTYQSLERIRRVMGRYGGLDRLVSELEGG